MRRDPDLIVRLLEALEETPAGESPEQYLYEVVGDMSVLRAHLRLMCDDGLVELGAITPSFPWLEATARMTSRGHDLLDGMRGGRLQKALDWIKDTGRTVTIEVLLEWVRRQGTGDHE